MTKYYIYEDERWPDYHLEESPTKNEPYTIKCDGEIELTEDEYGEWVKIRKRYDKWMDRFSRASGRDVDV